MRGRVRSRHAERRCADRRRGARGPHEPQPRTGDAPRDPARPALSRTTAATVASRVVGAAAAACASHACQAALRLDAGRCSLSRMGTARRLDLCVAMRLALRTATRFSRSSALALRTSLTVARSRAANGSPGRATVLALCLPSAITTGSTAGFSASRARGRSGTPTGPPPYSVSTGPIGRHHLMSRCEALKRSARTGRICHRHGATSGLPTNYWPSQSSGA
jgi:hypothetical protein